ncbi:hypothetical protein [Bifidobacterium moukalabense]|uniref:hypothetical protein n=1 Tax=Bifidobacterium moukalabense TaxID=1333651 RepID=UPI0010F51DD1|nr:hypothetical protein [Bifidobacterium moukalabense]
MSRWKSKASRDGRRRERRRHLAGAGAQQVEPAAESEGLEEWRHVVVERDEQIEKLNVEIAEMAKFMRLDAAGAPGYLTAG